MIRFDLFQSVEHIDHDEVSLEQTNLSSFLLAMKF
jgi:hypothetical protein